MTQRDEVYQCELCGNLVSVVHGAGGSLVCCGQDMVHLKGNTTDAAVEKHVPVIEKVAEGYKVTVGSVPHPMEDKHYIEWVQLVADGEVYRQFLKPGQEPVAIFCVKAEKVTAREYCNLHGLWKG